MSRRDAFSELRREYRTLVPVQRRRAHLVLLSQPRESTERPAVRAVVRPSDRPALDPLIERLGQAHNGLLLRLAIYEDGVIDADLLWRVGQRVDPKAPKAVTP